MSNSVSYPNTLLLPAAAVLATLHKMVLVMTRFFAIWTMEAHYYMLNYWLIIIACMYYLMLIRDEYELFLALCLLLKVGYYF